MRWKWPQFLKAKLHVKRPDTDGLINEPVELWVGGCGTSRPKRVEIRETSNMVQGKHFNMVIQGIADVLSSNKEILGLISDPSKITNQHEFLFASIPEAFRNIVADLVGEDSDYVENEMSGRQTTAVLATYMDLIGFEYMKSAFSWALESWKQAGTKAAKVTPIKPPEPVEPLSKSDAS